MAKTEIILQVFVGSPGDVKEERIVLEEVIREGNITWSDTFNIRLDLIQWQTHTSPGMSEDTQAAINEQIPNTYDIFIAIFWSRLGTPTPRADSGTIEEFNRAYERYKADPNSIEIMVYFKETPIKPSQYNHDQMKKIADFKSHLSKLGLYWEFESTDSFRKLLLSHLNKKIKKWADRYNSNPVVQNENQLTVDEQLPETDELIMTEELIENIENGAFLIDRVTFTLTQIVKGIECMHKKLNKRNSNGKKQKRAIDIPMSEKEILRTATNATYFLDDFTCRMKCDIPLFEKSLSKAMESYSGISNKRFELINDNSNSIQHALDTVSAFRSATIKSNVKVRNFRKLLEGFLWKEPEFEIACQNAFESIDKLMQHIENGKQQATKVETYLSELI